MPKAETKAARASTPGKRGTQQGGQNAPLVHVQNAPAPRRTSSNGGGLVSKGVQGFLSVFEPQLAQDIVDSVRKGMPIPMAANKYRVSRWTVEDWLKKGEEDPLSRYSGFAADIRQAQAEFVETCMQGIVDAGLTDAKQWTALMTALERLHPEYFRRPDTKTTQNINIAVGIVERQLHEMHEAGEIIYDGG